MAAQMNGEPSGVSRRVKTSPEGLRLAARNGYARRLA
jgi:hypothetical protein